MNGLRASGPGRLRPLGREGRLGSRLPAAAAAIALALSTSAAVGQAGPDGPDQPRYLIDGIDLHGRSIVFAHAGDIWQVPLQGGEARRLTGVPDAYDTHPAASPDGAWIAFSRRSNGNRDVYVVPAGGGRALRLTHHPAGDVVRGWTSDGTGVVFRSEREASQEWRLYTIARDGGFPAALPLRRADDAAFSADGGLLAFVPHALPDDFIPVMTEWRHYRGGLRSGVGILDLAADRAETLTGGRWNDRHPMWSGDRLLFLSDRTGAYNLYTCDPAACRAHALTRFDEFGIEDASVAGRTAAFVRDGRLYSLDLDTEVITPVTFTLRSPPRPPQAPRRPAERWIRAVGLSATGERGVAEIRGDVFTFDLSSAAPGITALRNITDTPGAAERSPILSPDGRMVAYFSDRTGEYGLYIQDLASRQTRRIELRGREPSVFAEPTWAPDGARIAFSDKGLRLWIADVSRGVAAPVDSSAVQHAGLDAFQPAWSPDGRLLAYAKHLDTRVRAVFLRHIASGSAFQVTDGRWAAANPVFSRDGLYLYFVESASARLGESFGMTARLVRPLVTRSIGVAVLRPGMGVPGRGPHTTRSETEAAGSPEHSVERVAVEPGALEDVSRRVARVDGPVADVIGLGSGVGSSLYELILAWPPTPGAGDAARVLRQRFADRPSGSTVLAEDVSLWAASRDGRVILVRHDDDRWALLRVNGDQRALQDVSWGGLTVRPDLTAEWRQIYREAWRIARHYFYDPGHHGYHPARLEAHYATYLPTVATREDLNRLLRKALGHLSVSHQFVGGGDVDGEGDTEGVGLLGADIEPTDGRYRIRRILRSFRSNENRAVRSPLAEPGVQAGPGDYIIRVDSTEVTTERNFYAYFADKAGRPTTLTLSANGDGSNPRTFTVVPLADETALRRLDWAEENRRRVERWSDGRIAYIYLPIFSDFGLERFLADFSSAVNKEGVVFDIRYNPGGSTSDLIFDLLDRRELYRYVMREGLDLPFPELRIPGPRALLINRFDYSAAETLAWMFKHAGLGEVVGTQTAGMGIGGFAPIPPLVDGGFVSVPNRGAFDPHTAAWDIENRGVAPTLPVEIDHEAWRAGADPQLRAAVDAVLAELRSNPPDSIRVPEYPRHHEGRER